MRLIDADALVESIKGWYCKDCDNYNYVRCRACGTDDAINAIENAPTINWPRLTYCPNCGAAVEVGK